MHPFKERVETTANILKDPDISAVEGLKHLYWHIRFELLTIQREALAVKMERLTKRSNKFSSRLNTNLRVFGFRKELEQTNL